MDNISNKEFLYFQKIVEKKNKKKILDFIEQKNNPTLHYLLSYFSREQRISFFVILPLKLSIPILCDMPDKKEIRNILIKLERKKTAQILKKFPSDLQIDILKIFPFSIAQEVIQHFSIPLREQVHSIIRYENDTAGGLMIQEYLEYPIHWTTNDIKKDLEKNAEIYSNYDIQYTYIVDENRKLQGVIPFRKLLFAPQNTTLENLIKKDIVALSWNTKINAIKDYFNEYHYLAFPVINEKGELLGILTKFSIDNFLQEETVQEFLKLTGIIGGEEFRSQPIYERSAKRLSWLSVNILLNFLAASVIIYYQDTLAQAITLAVFLPIISDMSGCSGNQSIAVTLREISLGLISPKEILKVLFKESLLGLINGIILGLIIACIAYLWKENIYLGLVVGLALALNTITAVCLGSALPIILKYLKIDPAIASSPLLTTITDMLGFFFIFVLASHFLHLIA